MSAATTPPALLSSSDASDSYVPFGDEWEKEVMKLPKRFIIGMLRTALLDNQPMQECNVNDVVRIKLTPHGRDCLRQNYEILNASYGGMCSWLYEPPIEDADGWSEWQLHHLMSELGRHVGSGCDLLFETTIRLELRTKTAA